jgi:hypothetical protein
MVKVKVVLEDVHARENGAKAHIAQKYYLTRSRIKL